MNKAPIVLLAALTLLEGCGGQPRKGGPAPVESALNPKGQAVAAPAPQAPAVDVYAYRAPNTAPPPAPVPAEFEKGQEPLPAPVAEGPVPHGGRGPSTSAPDIDPGLASAITWTPPASAPRATPSPAPASAQTAAPTQSQPRNQPQSQTPGPGPAANPQQAKSGTPAPAPVSTQGPAAATSPRGAATPTTVASLSPPPAAPKPPPPPPEVRYTAPPPPAPTLPAAAASLAAQAEKQRAQGDYVAAAATLERAIRIQPREAYLWNRLARVRLDQKNYTQASSLAQKSNSLSKDQAQIKDDNWGMIAATRRATGDTKGAEEAEAKAGGR